MRSAIFTFALLLLCGTAHAQSLASVSASPPGTMTTSQFGSDLAGTYTGDFNGTPMTLALQQQGASINGYADAEGYRYVLNGTVNGTTARGTFSDPQNGGGLNMELALQGNQLTLTLLAQDPSSGQTNRIVINFQRGGAVPNGPSAPTGSVAQGGTPTGAGYQGAQGGGQAVERDPSLVGMWSFTETMMSGDYSAVTQLQLQINPDGSYAYGNGRTLAGGSNAYGSISGDTGSGGDVSRGNWRTQGSIVYIQENGMGGWVPYARYYVEGNSMMFTFGDGSRRIWKR